MEWKSSDYDPSTHVAAGNRAPSRLIHPRPGGNPRELSAFVVLTVLMHAGECFHESASMIAPQFIVAATDLQKIGWPIEIKQQPLRVVWSSDVPASVIAAWRTTFGDRGAEAVSQLECVSQFRRVDKPVTYVR